MEKVKLRLRRKGTKKIWCRFLYVELLLEPIDGRSGRGGRGSAGGPHPPGCGRQPPSKHHRVLRQLSQPREQRVLLAFAEEFLTFLRQRRRGDGVGPGEEDRAVEELAGSCGGGGGRGRGAHVDGEPLRVREQRRLLRDQVGELGVLLPLDRLRWAGFPLWEGRRRRDRW